ncbi:MAG: STAS domain-containing protein [Clostridia bacterium]|nr:STAS domain-containing protein [Clostridia bacterium]
MEIIKENNCNVLTVKVSGRLDTVTAPELEEKIGVLDGIKELVLDLEKLEYISSAGLRVLLNLQKQMNKIGKMTVKNISSDVMEVFEITGFSEILTIE